MLIGGIVFSLQVWVIIGDLFPGLRQAFDATPQKLKMGQGSEDLQERSTPSREIWQVGIMLTWMALFFSVLTLLGFLPAILIFVSLFLAISGRISWWFALLMSSGLTVVIWGVFVSVMRFQLFQGILFGTSVPPF
jgi:hypothetical protein